MAGNISILDYDPGDLMPPPPIEGGTPEETISNLLEYTRKQSAAFTQLLSQLMSAAQVGFNKVSDGTNITLANQNGTLTLAEGGSATVEVDEATGTMTFSSTGEENLDGEEMVTEINTTASTKISAGLIEISSTQITDVGANADNTSGVLFNTTISAGSINLTTSTFSGSLAVSSTDAKCTDANADQTSAVLSETVISAGKINLTTSTFDGSLAVSSTDADVTATVLSETVISAGKINLTTSTFDGSLAVSSTDAKCTDAAADETAAVIPDFIVRAAGGSPPAHAAGKLWYCTADGGAYKQGRLYRSTGAAWELNEDSLYNTTITAGQIALTELTGQINAATQISAGTIVVAKFNADATGRMFTSTTEQTNIEGWIKGGDVTKIDGGKISTNTILADSINTTDLFVSNDMIVGNYAGGAGMFWDQSEATFDIKGKVTCTDLTDGVIDALAVDTGKIAANAVTDISYSQTVGSGIVSRPYLVTNTITHTQTATDAPILITASMELENNALSTNYDCTFRVIQRLTYHGSDTGNTLVSDANNDIVLEAPLYAAITESTDLVFWQTGEGLHAAEFVKQGGTTIRIEDDWVDNASDGTGLELAFYTVGSIYSTISQFWRQKIQSDGGAAICRKYVAQSAGSGDMVLMFMVRNTQNAAATFNTNAQSTLLMAQEIKK